MHTHRVRPLLATAKTQNGSCRRGSGRFVGVGIVDVSIKGRLEMMAKKMWEMHTPFDEAQPDRGRSEDRGDVRWALAEIAAPVLLVVFRPGEVREARVMGTGLNG